MKSTLLGNLRRLQKVVRLPVRGLIVLAAAVRLIATAANIVAVTFVTKILDQMDRIHVDIVLIQAISIFTFFLIMEFYSNQCCGIIAKRIISKMYRAFAEKLCTLEQREIDGRQSGDFITRATRDFDDLLWLYAYTLPNMFGLGFGMAAVVAVLTVMNWKLSVAMIALMPGLIILASHTQKALMNNFEREGNAEDDINASLQDINANLTGIKAFSLEKPIMERFEKPLDHYRKIGLKIHINLAYQDPLWRFTLALPEILTFLMGGYLMMHEQLTIGQLVAFTVLSGHLKGPLYSLFNWVANFSFAKVSSGRIMEIFDLADEVSGKSQNRMPGSAISIRDLHFTYPGRDSVFQGIHIDVEKGEKVAIVGESGCGKSTLLKLISGLYQAQAGHISVLGRDVASWDVNEMRSHIAVVTQDVFLFTGTLLENVQMGLEGASLNAVEDACRHAGILDFIESLPEQWETQAGENGVFLSGGQKQRISIARALLRDAPILLLDEPTSALDAQTEANLQEALSGLMQGKTTVVVAHRLSTVRDADRILCLQNGVIAEEGTHQQLMALGGIYYRLYEGQMNDSEQEVEWLEAEA